MARFQDVIEYVCSRYSSVHRLDEARLGFLLYLIDWRSAIQRNKPVTDIEWTLHEFGPKPDPVTANFVLSAATYAPPDFSAIGRAVDAVPSQPLIETDDREVIDFVLKIVAPKSETELQQLVFSTFPVLAQPKRAPLNLVALAAKYNSEYRYAAGS